ncbi:uncharacterized protein LOC113319966 [Papaver somniferum]|uniref:uncharacterized protein LOC113319966 n=1 Tax=Papaver somniferum TaxID=3469 RepID=UPI000E704082|nr:uncharacterized protein LOC113319966 [Papaver somniferum]
MLAPDEESLIIPPDEERCCRNDGVKWRCRNFRINTDTTYCEKHYKYYSEQRRNKKKLKMRGGDDKGDDSGPEIETTDSNCSKRRRLMEEDDMTGGIPTTNDTSADRIVEGGTAKIGTKRKNVQREKGSREIKSFMKTKKPVVELNSPEQYNNKCSELSEELEKKQVDLEKMELELEKMKLELEKKKVDLEKKNVVIEKMKMELEKKNVEGTKLRGELEETRKTAAAKYDDATDYWKKKCSDLESVVLKMENEKSTMKSVESRISNLESLVLGNGKELRCEELRNSEKMESEVRDLQNETTQTGERQKDKNNMSIPTVETSSGGSKDSRVYELKTKGKVLNVKEGRKGWGCFEGRPSQHGSSSQAHLEMSKKIFVNLDSDSDEDGDTLGDPVEMLAIKNWSRNKDEMKWKSEADMLSSFEEDPELCMKAVCALY